jgi:hypothetical protein
VLVVLGKVQALKSPLLAGFLKKQRSNLFCWGFLGWFFAFLWLGSCIVHSVSQRLKL